MSIDDFSICPDDPDPIVGDLVWILNPEAVHLGCTGVVLDCKNPLVELLISSKRLWYHRAEVRTIRNKTEDLVPDVDVEEAAY